MNMSETKKEEIKLLKCKYCKKSKVNFHYHQCKKGIQEFYGCSDCDNWCIACKPDWNPDGHQTTNE